MATNLDRGGGLSNSNLEAGGGGGGAGFTLGPTQNTFGDGTTVTTAPEYSADQAASEALRDTYATANAAWLALYSGDRSFYIRLIWAGNATAFQRRNAAGTGWEDVTRIVPGTTGRIGPPGATRTATQIAALLDTEITNALWRSRLSGTDLLNAVDAAVGTTVWRTDHTALHSATQIINLLDNHYGNDNWRTPGTGTGTGGITVDQATDAAGALLATITFFTYDSSTDALVFNIPDDYITSAMLDADTNAEKTAFRTKIDAEQSGAVRPDGTVAFTAPVAGATPTAIAHLTRKDYVDSADGLKAALAGAVFTGAVEGITPTDNVHLTRKDYVDTQDNLSALLAGAVFTGIVSGIAPTAAANFVTKEYADANYGGSTPVQTHDLWVGWSTDNTVTETEVLAGVSSDTATATLPTGSGNQFLWVWRSNVDGGDPSEVYIAGGLNVRNTLGAAAALTVSGVAGQIIVSVTSQNVGLLGGENVRVV